MYVGNFLGHAPGALHAWLYLRLGMHNATASLSTGIVGIWVHWLSDHLHAMSCAGAALGEPDKGARTPLPAGVVTISCTVVYASYSGQKVRR